MRVVSQYWICIHQMNGHSIPDYCSFVSNKDKSMLAIL